jgi:predicted RNase H-like HicB family nuclease
VTPSAPWTAYRILFELDEELGTWHFHVPELRITGGGGATLEEVALDADAAVAFALELAAERPSLSAQAAPSAAPVQCGVHLRDDGLWEVRCPCGWTSRRPFELRASAAKSRAWHLKTRHDISTPGVYESPDGWRAQCPRCDFTSGPWPTRRPAGSSLGGHLAARHPLAGDSRSEEP